MNSSAVECRSLRQAAIVPQRPRRVCGAASTQRGLSCGRSIQDQIARRATSLPPTPQLPGITTPETSGAGVCDAHHVAPGAVMQVSADHGGCTRPPCASAAAAAAACPCCRSSSAGKATISGSRRGCTATAVRSRSRRLRTQRRRAVTAAERRAGRSAAADVAFGASLDAPSSKTSWPTNLSGETGQRRFSVYTRCSRAT